MRAVVAAVMLVVIVSIALARQQPPQPPNAPLEQMKALDWLVGHWTGEGEMSFGPGNTHAVRVDEHVQRKLGGTILLVEGIGREGAPGGPDERIVHQALGVVFFDRASDKYFMDAFLSNGNNARCELELRERGFIWGFDDPRAGRIRYTTKLNDQSQWHEIGEMSRDGGQTWNQFFQMTLTRSADDTPDARP